MKTHEIASLLNNSDIKSSKFATRKWYDQKYTEYGDRNENDPSIKFEIKVVKSSRYNSYMW